MFRANVTSQEIEYSSRSKSQAKVEAECLAYTSLFNLMSPQRVGCHVEMMINFVQHFVIRVPTLNHQEVGDRKRNAQRIDVALDEVDCSNKIWGSEKWFLR